MRSWTPAFAGVTHGRVARAKRVFYFEKLAALSGSCLLISSSR